MSSRTGRQRRIWYYRTRRREKTKREDAVTRPALQCPECGCYGGHHDACPAGEDTDSKEIAREIRREAKLRKALLGKELRKRKENDGQGGGDGVK